MGRTGGLDGRSEVGRLRMAGYRGGEGGDRVGQWQGGAQEGTFG